MLLKSLLTKKTLDLDGFSGEFYQIFKKQIVPILPRDFMGLDKPNIKACQEKNSTDQYPYEHGGGGWNLNKIHINQIQEYIKTIIH